MYIYFNTGTRFLVTIKIEIQGFYSKNATQEYMTESIYLNKTKF